jgi:iron complex outermembrane receptor protein
LGRTTLTSLSAFRHASYALSLDDDQEQIDRIAADLAHDVTDFVSQELRLSGSLGSRTSYVLGFYYFDQRVTTDRLLTLGIDSGLPPGAALTTAGQVKTTSYALFGELEHHFDFGLVWSVGLRFTQEHRDAKFAQRDPTGIWTMIGLPNLSYAGSADDEDLSPSLTLLQPITPDIAVYGRIATGLNSAAFNVDLVSSTAGLTARPERATSFEIGLKSDLFRRRLRANAALFMTSYDDMQVSQLLGVGASLDNAGKATIKGFEVELTGHVSSRIKLNASLGYVDAVYDRYPQCGVPVSLGGGSTDCAGKTIIGAPRYTVSSSIEYTVPVSIGAVVARVSYNFQSPVNFEATNSPRFRGDTRNIVDTHIALSTARWDLSAWAKNVTDDVYVAYRDDRSAIGARQTTAYGDPRTFGVTATFRF